MVGRAFSVTPPEICPEQKPFSHDIGMRVFIHRNSNAVSIYALRGAGQLSRSIVAFSYGYFNALGFIRRFACAVRIAAL
jgi:hypothetical protein